MGYDSKGILVFNLKYEHAISFNKLVKFINYYQMPRSKSSKLFVIASGDGEANVYGSSYYWNFRTSSFKQVACLILYYITNLVCYTYFHWFFNPEFQHIFGKQTGYIFQSPKTIKTWTTKHYASLTQWYNTE